PAMPVPVQYRTTIEQATSYISCATATKPERFCDSFYRGQLASNLQAYFSRKRYYVQVLLNMQMGRPIAFALDGTTAEQVKSGSVKWSDDTLHVSELNAGSAAPDFVITGPVHPRLAASLAALLKRCLLSSCDFGWFR